MVISAKPTSGSAGLRVVTADNFRVARHPPTKVHTWQESAQSRPQGSLIIPAEASAFFKFNPCCSRTHDYFLRLGSSSGLT
jgi:hypothetical protein